MRSSRSSARRSSTRTAFSDSGSSRNRVLRDSKGPLTEKNGFSVVAPIRVSSPCLHRRQQGVLLRPVEAVHLVQEQDRPPPLLAQEGLGPVHGLAHVLHAGGDRGQAHEGPLGGPGDQAGQGGLARAGRAPKHRRAEPVGFDERPQRPARGQQVLLAHHLVEDCGRMRAASGPSVARRRSSAAWKRSAVKPALGRRCRTRAGPGRRRRRCRCA